MGTGVSMAVPDIWNTALLLQLVRLCYCEGSRRISQGEKQAEPLTPVQ